jgi:hypothetical protein
MLQETDIVLEPSVLQQMEQFPSIAYDTGAAMAAL